MSQAARGSDSQIRGRFVTVAFLSEGLASR